MAEVQDESDSGKWKPRRKTRKEKKRKLGMYRPEIEELFSSYRKNYGEKIITAIDELNEISERKKGPNSYEIGRYRKLSGDKTSAEDARQALKKGATQDNVAIWANVDGRTIKTPLEDLENGQMIKCMNKDTAKKEKEKIYTVRKFGREADVLFKEFLSKYMEAVDRDSFSSEGKLASFDYYQDFIKENLKFERKDCKVLCFPSEDFNEHFVYNDAGINDESIVGIEIDPQKAEKIREKISKGEWKIRLEEGDAKDFVEKSEEKFHIIHLDYDTYFQEEHQKVIETILAREMLVDGGILAITTKRGRETKNVQKKIQEMAIKVAVRDNIFSPCTLEDTCKTERIVEAKKINDVIREKLPYAVGMIDWERRNEEIKQKHGDIINGIEKDKETTTKILKETYLPTKTLIIEYQSRSPMQIFIYKFEKNGVKDHVDYTKWANEFVKSKLGRLEDPQKFSAQKVKKVVTEDVKAEIHTYVDKRKKEFSPENEDYKDRNMIIRDELMDMYDLRRAQAFIYAVGPTNRKKKVEVDQA